MSENEVQLGDTVRSPEDKLDEVLSRVRRIETRQMKMAQAQGINPANGRDKITVADYTRFPVIAEVAGLDVSLGDVIDICRKSGITTVISLRCKGKYIGQFDVRGVEVPGSNG